MIKGKLSSEAIGEILDRLAEDDEFRELMLGDPRSALAPYGLDVDMTQAPSVRKLPSKEAIRAARKDLHDKVSNDQSLMILLLK